MSQKDHTHLDSFVVRNELTSHGGAAMSIKAILSIVLTATAVAAEATPVIAVSGGNSFSVASNNDFRTVTNGLNDRGLLYYSTSRTITLTQAATLSLFFLGSESGYQNRFTSGTITWLETDGGGSFVTPVSQGSYFVPAGSYAPFFSTPSGGATTDPSLPGDNGFGIFMSSDSPDGFTASSLVFGYDDPTSDNPANFDKDYDDFMVQVVATAAPEPAIWAMMLTGFGLSGWVLRRQQRPATGRATAQ